MQQNNTLAIAQEFVAKWDTYTQAVYGDGEITDDQFTEACEAVLKCMNLEHPLTDTQVASIKGIARRAYRIAHEEAEGVDRSRN